MNVTPKQQIVYNIHVGKKLNVLEGAGDSQLANFMGF
jgi:hypothetical protein